MSSPDLFTPTSGCVTPALSPSCIVRVHGCECRGALCPPSGICENPKCYLDCYKMAYGLNHVSVHVNDDRTWFGVISTKGPVVAAFHATYEVPTKDLTDGMHLPIAFELPDGRILRFRVALVTGTDGITFNALWQEGLCWQCLRLPRGARCNCNSSLTKVETVQSPNRPETCPNRKCCTDLDASNTLHSVCTPGCSCYVKGMNLIVCSSDDKLGCVGVTDDNGSVVTEFSAIGDTREITLDGKTYTYRLDWADNILTGDSYIRFPVLRVV